MRSSLPFASSFIALLACSSPASITGAALTGSYDAGAPSAPSSDPTGGDDNGPGSGVTSTPSPPPTSHPSPPPPVDAGAASPEAGPPGAPDAGALPADAGSTTTDGGAAAQALLAHCVATLSSYRAQAGVAGLTESSALEAYGAAAAASDAQSGQTHGYFNGNGGSGVSAAESELPGWPLPQYASMTDLIDQGAAAIFNQGPGAAPYDNLVNPAFTQAGCGIATTPEGNVWVAIEYGPHN